MQFHKLIILKIINTEHGLAQSQILSIFQDSDGNMWFGTNSGGVSKYNGNQFQNFTTNNGLAGNFVFQLQKMIKRRFYLVQIKD